MRFVEVYSLFMFDEELTGVQILSPAVKEAWDDLGKFILYYLRDSRLANTDRGREEAHRCLHRYAELCERLRVKELLTPNLHTSDCQLPFQEKYCGRPVQMNEL